MSKLLLFVSFLSIASSFAQNGSTDSSKPNIIFILTDDHATNAISAYSERFADISPTPNIDLLASQGAISMNTFSTNAICGPSRAAILTGKYSHVNQYYKNFKGGYFDGTQWTYPKAFQEAGYQTALVGKWHLASEPEGFDFFKYHVDHGEQGVYWNPRYNENGDIKQEKGYATNITTDFALEWLDKKSKDKPFCLLLQYKAPHREWSPDEKYQDLWKDEDLPMPNTFHDDYKGREKTAGDTHMTMDFLNRRDMKISPPDHLSKKEQRKWLDYGNRPGEIVKLNDRTEGRSLKEEKYQKYIKDYLATIKSVDDNIGRVLNYLKENGLENNTIVVYTSDQGFFLGEHGWFDKRFMYEESMRMPLIVRYPKEINPNTVVTDVVSNIDMAPTILDMAGIPIPLEVQGKSFFDNLKGNTPSDWRQSMYYHYYEYPFWHHVQPHYGIRTDRFKLIHFYYDVDVWEFYDLKNDPSELNNLIKSKEYYSTINSLKIDLQNLKEYYGNTMTLQALRDISDTDFGGLESDKKLKN